MRQSYPWALLALVGAFGVLTSILIDAVVGDVRTTAGYLLKQLGEGLALGMIAIIGVIGRRRSPPITQALGAGIPSALTIFVVTASRISLASEVGAATHTLVWTFPTAMLSALIATLFLTALSLTWLRIANARQS